MSTTNNGGPAFPSISKLKQRHYGSETPNSYEVTDGEAGMTLRDYFAAKAIQGICASGPSYDWADQDLATEAYAIADAMLAAREKGGAV